MTAYSDSSAAQAFKEVLCVWEANSKGIEATLHQIATGLQSAAERYLTLASHMSKVVPYEFPKQSPKFLHPLWMSLCLFKNPH